jgi:ATP-dependent DNA ligase
MPRAPVPTANDVRDWLRDALDTDEFHKLNLPPLVYERLARDIQVIANRHHNRKLAERRRRRLALVASRRAGPQSLSRLLKDVVPGAPQPPSGDEWLREIKHDGFRVIARKSGDRVKLYSRPGNAHRPLPAHPSRPLARLRPRS